jgi:dTDP-4-dehydrorhamnose reductase
MVFGSQSPRILEITNHIQENTPVEIFPNLIINVATDSKITQQIHYIINRNKHGIFHLGSTDLIHHDDFIKDVVNTLQLQSKVVYKRVYTTNDERYLAILPKYNTLPKHLQALSQDLLKDLEL